MAGGYDRRFTVILCTQLRLAVLRNPFVSISNFTAHASSQTAKPTQDLQGPMWPWTICRRESGSPHPRPGGALFHGSQPCARAFFLFLKLVLFSCQQHLSWRKIAMSLPSNRVKTREKFTTLELSVRPTLWGLLRLTRVHTWLLVSSSLPRVIRVGTPWC